MDYLTYHLTYLTKLLQPPMTYGWFPHVEHRAKELAEDPALAQLPALVRQEYERIRSESQSSRSSGRKQSCITKEKSNESDLDCRD